MTSDVLLYVCVIDAAGMISEVQMYVCDSRCRCDHDYICGETPISHERNTYFPRTKHWRDVCRRENDLVSLRAMVTYEEPSLRTCNECHINEAHKEWEARGGLLGAESLTVTLLRPSAPQISAMQCVSS